MDKTFTYGHNPGPEIYTWIILHEENNESQHEVDCKKTWSPSPSTYHEAPVDKPKPYYYYEALSCTNGYKL